jgi:hypothetical protein
MTGSKIKILLMIILGFLNNLTVDIYGGYNAKGDELEEKIEDIYNEKYYLMTDRTLYAVGEKILFKVFNISPGPIESIHWSKVMYLELTRNDGSSIQKGKYRLGLSGCDGYMEIPSKISSGYYYLRAYTKWMRNFPVSDFAFCRVTIINPFSPEILERRHAENGSVSYAESFIDETLRDENSIYCRTDKDIYKGREKVILSVELLDYDPYSRNEFCVSVIKTGAMDTMNYGILSLNQQVENKTRSVNYIPDMRGVSVSGRVIEKEGGSPVNKASVQLSVLGNEFDFLEYNTGADGNYVFSLSPLQGEKDMYIVARAGNTNPEILIDNDFNTDAFYIEGEEFRLTKAERNIAEEIILNMQIEKIYRSDKILDSLYAREDSVKTSFYGNPSTILYIDEYIELPTVEEVLFELVPEVIVKKRKDDIFISVTDNEIYHPDLAIFEPLVLLDHIPVHNLENLLKLSPSKISTIEVVNEIYIKGTSRYGGIISIFSRRGDIAGIDLPENSLFFDFQTFTEQVKVFYPYYGKSRGVLNIPDYRSCLYWNPELIPENNMKASLEFYTSDRKGQYMILIRGVSEDEKIIEGRCFFTVE